MNEPEAAATALREKVLTQFCTLRDSGARHFYEQMAIHHERFSGDVALQDLLIL